MSSLFWKISQEQGKKSVLGANLTQQEIEEDRTMAEILRTEADTVAQDDAGTSSAVAEAIRQTKVAETTNSSFPMPKQGKPAKGRARKGKKKVKKVEEEEEDDEEDDEESRLVEILRPDCGVVQMGQVLPAAAHAANVRLTAVIDSMLLRICTIDAETCWTQGERAL